MREFGKLVLDFRVGEVRAKLGRESLIAKREWVRKTHCVECKPIAEMRGGRLQIPDTLLHI